MPTNGSSHSAGSTCSNDSNGSNGSNGSSGFAGSNPGQTILHVHPLFWQ